MSFPHLDSYVGGFVKIPSNKKRNNEDFLKDSKKIKTKKQKQNISFHDDLNDLDENFDDWDESD